MKKLLLIITLSLSGIFINAQSGNPTKEETVKFIDKTLKKAIGEKISIDLVLTDIHFNPDKLIVVSSYASERPETDIYENMDWTRFSILYENNNIYSSPKIDVIALQFDNKLKTTFDGKSKYNRQTVSIYVPKDSVESVKKAILHLVELAKKEEDSNPFK